MSLPYETDEEVERDAKEFVNKIRKDCAAYFVVTVARAKPDITPREVMELLCSNFNIPKHAKVTWHDAFASVWMDMSQDLEKATVNTIEGRLDGLH